VGEAPQKESLTHKVKEMAKSAVEKVEGAALHAVAEKVKDAVHKK
jgi:hypothetical protein